MGKSTLGTLVVLAIIALSTASYTVAAEPPEYLKSFGPDGTEATEFSRVGSVAVDEQSHAVYVTDRSKGALFKFDAEGNKLDFGGTAPYISGNEISGLLFKEERGDGRNQVAVNSASHIIYVTDEEGETLKAFQEDGEPALFGSGPGAGTNEIGGFSGLFGVAVDQNGNIYASQHSGVVTIFTGSGELLTEFSAVEPNNLAVDGNGVVYVLSGEIAISTQILKYTPSEIPASSTTTYASSAGPSAPEANTLAVDPATNDLYVAGLSTGISWYDETGTLLASFAKTEEEGELGASGGLAIAGGKLFVSNNTAETSQVEIFGPKQIKVDRPTIVSTSVRDISASSATLLAEINPNTLSTSYRFEYGFEDCAVAACTSVPLGGAGIGSGQQPVSVAQDVTSLLPATTYHYRVVAQNSEGISKGLDQVFKTQPAGLGFQLADHREWEMVSPPNKHEGRLVQSSWGLVQAAADGSGIAYLSRGSLEAGAEGARSPEASSVLGTWSPQGWRSQDVTPPNAEVAPVANGDLGEYKLFNPNLSQAILTPRSETPLSVEASERAPYLRMNTQPATYRPLATGKEGFANVPSGTEFGGDSFSAVGAIGVAAASADLSHVVLVSIVPLVAGASDRALYEWADGQLEPVSVLPGSEKTIVLGAIGGGLESTRHAISEDGSRVFWTASSKLYMRDTEADETVRLDLQSGGSGSGSVSPVFQGASADGHVVYFTDEQQLTGNASPDGRDLYRCEIPLGAPASGCAKLTDLSAPTEGSAESAKVQGLVSGLSSDGTKLYFVAQGVLDATPNQHGESATPKMPNLYIWEEGQGVRFVALLSKNDSADWGTTVGASGDYGLSTAVSPAGRYLSFMSERRLTGYDNRDKITGEGVQEVFRYDAVADRLDCLSCNPTGARPSGGNLDSTVRLVDPRAVWAGRRVAATLPEAAIVTVAGPSLYRPRAALDNGRVFFNAFDSLVPADSNGQWDVYAYEPTGVGDCTSASAGTGVAPSAGGCISLISSGTAEEEAAFMDASASGDDVFFLTPATLSVTDEDRELDLYDARVDGNAAVATPSIECSGEGCQPVTPAPTEAGVSSAAFNGPGNVRPKGKRRCSKGKHAINRKGRTRCVPRKHKHRSTSKRHHAKANHQGRAR